MTWTASVRLDLPGWLTLDSKDDLVEKVRESALPIESQDGRSVAVQWTADNEWDLRGAVQETLDEVESNFDWRGLTTEAIDRVKRWQGEAEPFA